MNEKQKLINKFDAEELEERFEMGWKLKKGEVKYDGSSSWDGIE